MWHTSKHASILMYTRAHGCKHQYTIVYTIDTPALDTLEGAGLGSTATQHYRTVDTPVDVKYKLDTRKLDVNLPLHLRRLTSENFVHQHRHQSADQYTRRRPNARGRPGRGRGKKNNDDTAKLLMGEGKNIPRKGIDVGYFWLSWAGLNLIM